MIGSRIKKARKAKGMTQIELGEIMGMTGQAVSKWEKGETVEPERTLSSFADALGVRLEWLKTGEEPMEREQTDDELIDALTDDPFVATMVRSYISLTEDQRAAVRAYAANLAREWHEEEEQPSLYEQARLAAQEALRQADEEQGLLS